METIKHLDIANCTDIVELRCFVSTIQARVMECKAESGGHKTDNIKLLNKLKSKADKALSPMKLKIKHTHITLGIEANFWKQKSKQNNPKSFKHHCKECDVLIYQYNLTVETE